MASKREEEWDSDEESEDGLRTISTTSVLLGVPDGTIEEPEDLKDPLVSKIGGPPVSLPYLSLSRIINLCSHLLKAFRHSLNLLTVKIVLDQWNLPCNCGVRERGAQWTEHFMFGPVHARAVSGNLEAKYSRLPRVEL